MAKHKHYDLIVAWANGAQMELEWKRGDSGWVGVVGTPVWCETNEYRIKPDPRATRDMAIAKAVEKAVKEAHVRWSSGFTSGSQEYNLATIIASVKE